MYILADVVKDTCGDYVLANFLMIVRRIMLIFQIIVPIIAIIALIRLFTKLLVDPENKKLKSGFKNWIIAFMVFFLLPTIIDIAMASLDNISDSNRNIRFRFASCWTAAKKNNSLGNHASVDDVVDNNPDVGE